MAAAWAVLDAVTDDSERAVDGLGPQLERIEVAVFQGDQDQSAPIHLQLRDATRLARAMHPMLTIFGRLERGEFVGAAHAAPRLVASPATAERRGDVARGPSCRLTGAESSG
jgi:hypothetical protein